jgi:mycothiol system anti-sigma-R factor
MYLFLDGEIPPSQLGDVQQHLDDCLPCLEAFEFEAELKEMVAKRCKEQVPPHLYEKIRVSIRTELEQCDRTNDQAKGIPPN